MSKPISATSEGSFGLSNTSGSISDGLSGSLQPASSIETAANVVNILLSLAGLIAVIAIMAVWIIAFVSVLRRTDLKEHKLIWILLLLFLGPIGVIAYAFVENRKKIGYYAIASYVALPVILTAWAVSAFIMSSLAYA